MALTRDDLDLDTSPASVRVRRSTRRSESGTVRTDLPKTATSIRTAPRAGVRGPPCRGDGDEGDRLGVGVGLRFLRDKLGKRFSMGVVFHTGRDAVPFGERLWALPDSALGA